MSGLVLHHVIGGNGAGKSTLLKVLSRITEPTNGYADIRGRVGSLLEVGTGFHPELTGRENVFLNGSLLGFSRRDIAYLPQSVDIDRTFPISVFDLVGTGLWRRVGFFGGMGKAARDKIAGPNPTAATDRLSEIAASTACHHVAASRPRASPITPSSA